MKFHLCIVLVHAVCMAANAENSATIDENSRKNADDGKFPYQVSLRTNNGTHVCSGVILDERLILSSASCVRAHNPNYAVMGVRGKKDDSLRIGIDRIKVHELYNSSSQENNIALLRTVYHIDFSSWIKPVGLSSRQWSADDQLSFRISGWNQTEVIYYLKKKN